MASSDRRLSVDLSTTHRHRGYNVSVTSGSYNLLGNGDSCQGLTDGARRPGGHARQSAQPPARLPTK